LKWQIELAGFGALVNALVGTRKNLGSASFDDFDVSAYLQKGRASTGIVWSAWAMMLVDTDSTARELTSQRDSSMPQSEDAFKLRASLLSQPQQANSGDQRSASFEEKLVFSALPRGSGANSEPELGVWLLAIPAKSDQADLAREFVEYATDLRPTPGASPNKQSLVAAHRGNIPRKGD
jgi:hypothetical protein